MELMCCLMHPTSTAWIFCHWQAKATTEWSKDNQFATMQVCQQSILAIVFIRTEKSRHGRQNVPNHTSCYSGRSYRSERFEFWFCVVVNSPIMVHSSILVQPDFFQFPKRNMRLGISLSIHSDFPALFRFRRETCESTCPSALIDVPFREQENVWRGLLVEKYRIAAGRQGFGLEEPAISVVTRPPAPPL